MGKLKKQGGYFNRQKQTLAGLLGEGDPEEAMSLSDRLMWGGMRMDPTDIADVTGSPIPTSSTPTPPPRTGPASSAPARGYACPSSPPRPRTSPPSPFPPPPS